MAVSKEYIPGSDPEAEGIFRYPFFSDKESKEFINIHGKIMFIVRGPPGTGKASLTNMLMYHYPSAIKCRADDYFTESPAPPSRTRESLKESHICCHKKVKKECEKGTHPVVVSNSHVKKVEFQEYLNYAQEYGYTVIFANTLDKFEVSTEILAKRNTKGLDKQYFKNRMKSWEDVFPLLMGWFLNGDDSFYLLHQLHFALDALLRDESFCRDFNVFNKGSLLHHYRAKKMLFCIAGFSKSIPSELEEYYKSTKVREAYGKCFTLPVQAYIITRSDIFAMVLLNDTLNSLTFKPNFEDNSHEEENIANICRKIRSMYSGYSYKFQFISLESNFSNKCKTAFLSDKSNDYLKIDESSFIHIAQREEKKFTPYELNKLLKRSFNGIIDGSGKLTADKFGKLKDGYKSCRLHKDAWVVVLPKDLAVKTVFTGLYI